MNRVKPKNGKEIPPHIAELLVIIPMKICFA